MIISNSCSFIYIHIPKCGGTTVSSYLERYLLPQDISLNLNPHDGWQKSIDAFKKKWGLFKHSSAKEIERAMTSEHFCQYKSFTFTRNPFSRAYSAYTFTLLADAKFRPDSQRYKDIKNLSFEEFLQTKYMQEYQLLQAKKQTHFIQGTNAKIQLFKLEEIQNSMKYISEKIICKKEIPFSTARKNWSSQPYEYKKMSQDAQSIIKDLYYDDFVALNYSFNINEN